MAGSFRILVGNSINIRGCIISLQLYYQPVWQAGNGYKGVRDISLTYTDFVWAAGFAYTDGTGDNLNDIVVLF